MKSFLTVMALLGILGTAHAVPVKYSVKTQEGFCRASKIGNQIIGCEMMTSTDNGDLHQDVVHLYGGGYVIVDNDNTITVERPNEKTYKVSGMCEDLGRNFVCETLDAPESQDLFLVFTRN